MTLIQRLRSWQVAADHHAPEYFWLALKIAPFMIRKRPTIDKDQAVRTWFKMPLTNTSVRVTYKRHPNFSGRRIEIQIGRTLHYFGPRDLRAIEALLAPL